MKDDVTRRVAGPAVAAFDAQVEAEEAGVLFTPDQWSFARRTRLDRLPTPRARGSVPPPPPTSPAPSERVTQEMAAEELESLVERCRRSLAHTCPARPK